MRHAILRPVVLRPDGSTSYALHTSVLCLDVLRTTLLQSYVLRTMVVRLVVLCPATYLTAFCRGIVLRLGKFRPYIVLELCNWVILVQNFGAWENTMSSDDESTTTHLEPRYQLWSNTQSFEPISLSSWASSRYHQASTAPSSSSTTPIRNSGSGHTTSTIHQSPFGGVN